MNLTTTKTKLYVYCETKINTQCTRNKRSELKKM